MVGANRDLEPKKSWSNIKLEPTSSWGQHRVGANRELKAIEKLESNESWSQMKVGIKRKFEQS